jgi:hypothetical protein
MALDIGRIAFEAYATSVRHTTYQGNTMPKWEALDKDAQDGWRHAACAVLDYMERSEEEMKNGVIG